MIPRTPSFSTCGDACLYGGGGFSIDMKFWWHLEWPEEIKGNTKLFLPENKSAKMININVLEYATIILNYAAALTVLEYDGVGDDIHLVLLNWADNTSAVRWTNQECKKYLVWKALGRTFCTLLID